MQSRGEWPWKFREGGVLDGLPVNFSPAACFRSAERFGVLSSVCSSVCLSVRPSVRLTVRSSVRSSVRAMTRAGGRGGREPLVLS